jgi:polyhydroxybutyrate depolymerase
LIQTLREELPIDDQRLYLTGLSKGGMLAYRFACEESRLVAAIAVVSAALTYPRCRPRVPVSVLHIHGDLDENVPLRGGKGRYTAARNLFPPVWDGVRFWLEINGCRDTPERNSPSADSSCWHYSDCRGQLETVFCLIRGSGHGWPGSGALGATAQPIAVSQTFNATEVICQFFERHTSVDYKAKRADA